jgi:cytochrome c oxidase subunit 4
MAERRQATVEQLIRTYAALLLLMVPTLAITFFDWGVVNPVVNLGVAVLQAALIVGNFMGLRWASPLVRVAAIGGFFFLSFLFVLTLADFLTRGLG